MKYKFAKKICTAALAAIVADTAFADENERILALEKQLKKVRAEVDTLNGEFSDLYTNTPKEQKLTLGGYGEIHANFVEGGDDMIDIHRLVMYVGYDFTDWIKLTSEVELEHAYVSSSSGGEISIEQLYIDFMLADSVNIRAGRVLAPMGIINQKHEPTLFYGVERPNVDKYIIPTTWSLDGAGLFGYPLSWLSYELYAAAGLDGSGFSAKEGIRGGRIKERQGLNDPALTGRMDFYPFVDADLPADQALRLGVSGYYGGTDNQNKGGSIGTNNAFTMLSTDFEYDISRLHLRGVIALGENSHADQLAAGVGEQIFGWYLEGGVSIMPDGWKNGKLKEADLIPFVRLEEYDTQYKMPDGTTATGEYNRNEITIGANFLLTPNFVVKMDCQFQTLENNRSDINTRYNCGLGWVFK
ncbi:MAG: hypothetical protein OES84_03250 [Kiritimatiellaceae bacterium]|nr:hypothetical protein [Kiritimatiellaceae bacterium]